MTEDILTPAHRAHLDARKAKEQAAARVKAERRRRAEAQRQALANRAYEDYSGSPADLLAYHRRLKADFLAREAARRAA